MKIAFVAVVAASASLASASLADIGVVEATGAFQLAGASSTSYVSAIGAGWNPRIEGYDFGSVNALTGQSLLLQNWYFENYAYNGGSTPAGAATNNNWLDGANVAALVVTIKSGSTVVSSNTYSLYQTGDSGNNRFWQLAVASQNTNLAAGLANGSYSVEFTSTFNVNQWTGSVSQFNATTATSTGSFTVVPAPGALALLGVAGLVGVRRRR
jgi:MYXO-CTERM domain-containing protein